MRSINVYFNSYKIERIKLYTYVTIVKISGSQTLYRVHCIIATTKKKQSLLNVKSKNMYNFYLFSKNYFKVI